MSLLQYYDRIPSKKQAVSAGETTNIINFPLKTYKLITPNQDQKIFTHLLVDD